MAERSSELAGSSCSWKKRPHFVHQHSQVGMSILPSQSIHFSDGGDKNSTSLYCHFKTLGTGMDFSLTLQRLLTGKLYKPVAKESKLQKPKEVMYGKFYVKTYQVPVLFQYNTSGADCHTQDVLCQ